MANNRILAIPLAAQSRSASMASFSACLKCMLPEHMGILFAHARDEWNNLSSAPFLIFERAAAGFQTGDLRCEKDLVKRNKRL